MLAPTVVGVVDECRRRSCPPGNLSELDWRLICQSRTLVSSKACPDAMAVQVCAYPCRYDHGREDVSAGGAGATPLAGMCDLPELVGV